MLGRQQVFLELDETECPDAEDLTEIMQNVHLNNNFLNLAREVSEWMNGQMDGWMDGWMDGRIDRWMDEWMDR